jgi:hypothetical protein
MWGHHDVNKIPVSGLVKNRKRKFSKILQTKSRPLTGQLTKRPLFLEKLRVANLDKKFPAVYRTCITDSDSVSKRQC